jgi:hypothetical protein
LWTPYQGSGATLYAVIRQLSDLTQVWNGTAFETYANANVATYDVALADKGGDAYAADMPADITAGDYRVWIYEQAGGTPAITDLILRSYSFHWNGTAASETGTVTLSAYALTTLTEQKAHQRITTSTDDDLLKTLINAVSAEIERVTGRQFKARDRRQWLNLNGQRRVLLPHPPVQHVTRIAYGSQIGLSVTYSGSGISAQVSVYRDPESPDGGGVRLVTVNTAGVATTNSLTFAAYPSLSTMATAIAAVSGWTATVGTNRPSYELHVTGGQNAKSYTVQLTYADKDYADTYRVDELAGTVTFDPSRGGPWGWWPAPQHNSRMPCGFQSLFIQYRSGFETIPADVSLLCREMVKEAWYAGSVNTAAQSGSLGPYSFNFTQQQADRVRARLAPFILDGWVGGSV